MVDPHTIGVAAGILTTYTFQRKIVRTSDGTIHALLGKGGVSGRTTHFYSYDDGVTWNSIDVFSNSGANGSIDKDSDDNLVAARGESTNFIKFKKATVTKGTPWTWAWGSEKTVYDTASDGYYPAIAVDGNDYYHILIERTNTCGIWSRCTDEIGNVWTNTTIPPMGVYEFGNMLVDSSNNLYLVFGGYYNNLRCIKITYAGGEAWTVGPANTIAPFDNNKETSTAVILPDNRIAVLYSSYAGPYELYFRKSTNPSDSTSWTCFNTIATSTSSRFSGTVIALTTAHLRVLYTVSNILYSKDSYNGGATWDASPTVVYTGGTSNAYPGCSREHQYLKFDYIWVKDSTIAVHGAYTPADPSETVSLSHGIQFAPESGGEINLELYQALTSTDVSWPVYPSFKEGWETFGALSNWSYSIYYTTLETSIVHHGGYSAKVGSSSSGDSNLKYTIAATNDIYLRTYIRFATTTWLKYGAITLRNANTPAVALFKGSSNRWGISRPGSGSYEYFGTCNDNTWYCVDIEYHRTSSSTGWLRIYIDNVPLFYASWTGATSYQIDGICFMDTFAAGAGSGTQYAYVDDIALNNYGPVFSNFDPVGAFGRGCLESQTLSDSIVNPKFSFLFEGLNYNTVATVGSLNDLGIGLYVSPNQEEKRMVGTGDGAIHFYQSQTPQYTTRHFYSRDHGVTWNSLNVTSTGDNVVARGLLKDSNDNLYAFATSSTATTVPYVIKGTVTKGSPWTWSWGSKATIGSSFSYVCGACVRDSNDYLHVVCPYQSTSFPGRIAWNRSLAGGAWTETIFEGFPTSDVSYAITKDSANNLYILAFSNNVGIYAMKITYNGGTSWSPGPLTLVYADASLNYNIFDVVTLGNDCIAIVYSKSGLYFLKSKPRDISSWTINTQASTSTGKGYLYHITDNKLVMMRTSFNTFVTYDISNDGGASWRQGPTIATLPASFSYSFGGKFETSEDSEYGFMTSPSGYNLKFILLATSDTDILTSTSNKMELEIMAANGLLLNSYSKPLDELGSIIDLQTMTIRTTKEETVGFESLIDEFKISIIIQEPLSILETLNKAIDLLLVINGTIRKRRRWGTG